MGGNVQMWSWRDDGLCWREAGMGLDVHDGDFLRSLRRMDGVSRVAKSPPLLLITIKV